MWSGGYRRPSSVQAIQAAQFADIIGSLAGRSVIDFGCGAGHAGRVFLDRGCRVIGVDIAANALSDDLRDKIEFHRCALWDLPEQITADFGFCSHVMEHIPPFKVHDTFRAVRRSVRGPVFFDISLVKDRGGLKVGKVLHLTVKPQDWWHDALSQHWCEVHPSQYGKKGAAAFVVKP